MHSNNPDKSLAHRDGANMPRNVRSTMFVMFLFSGFCGLLYQVIWIRLAYAAFGITTPVMSVVISVFMLGLLIGSAFGGPVVRTLTKRFGCSALLLYGCIELLIGLGAFCVPRIFLMEQHRMLALGGMDSIGYLAVSGLAITAALLPWCILMGCTYPFMMAFALEYRDADHSSFSFLYLANIVGAMCGTIITVVILVELFGFFVTLAIAAAVNFSIAAAACFVGARFGTSPDSGSGAGTNTPGENHGNGGYSLLSILFVTGFATMCMEIIWSRNFTVVLKTVVYSYAALLTTYLMASWIGSYLYRKHLAASKVFSVPLQLSAIAAGSLLPLVANDPRVKAGGMLLALASICPLCVALGYLTPQLVDRYSRGNPTAAGRAYAVNTLGCILGPLFACYFLLPVLGVKFSLLSLSALLLCCFCLYGGKSALQEKRSLAVAAAAILLLLAGYFFCDTYEEKFAHARYHSIMRRDYAATVTSVGFGRQRQILVNGIDMTYLSPVTQFMAHLPLALCQQTPTTALDICFGMGTTFRSLVSWGIDATAIDLVPSVPRAFGYYWADADRVMSAPGARVIIDDGRRFLMRTNGKFDVITIDPPPPLEAAGSSLLYSVEFYEIAKRRLKEGGILQQWVYGSDAQVIEAVARSFSISFPYVKVFHPIEGLGCHFLGSLRPFGQADAAALVSRMPTGARSDLVTWCGDKTPEAYMAEMLSNEIPLSQVLAGTTKAMVTDPKPYNEYFLLRWLAAGRLHENTGAP
jgi:predicted membrane-bound spermidine synthase